MEMPQAVLKNWFDKLETVLHAEADLAGLLSHSTMVGSAREFFVSRVLKSVLPPSVHIGSGKVLTTNGRQSKQIDVILYDPSFPVFETQPGHGLYLAEGVIAAIEVKSTLDEKEFHIALENCLSVSSMPSCLTTRTIKFQGNQKLVFDYPTFRPCTYIFAFRTKTKRSATLCNQFGSWWEKKKFAFDDIPNMPEIVVAGSHLGIASGRWIKMGAEGDLKDKITKRHSGLAVTVMAFCEVKHRFGWLLAHLLTTISQRFSDERKLVFDQYTPIEKYWLDEAKGKTSSHISTPVTENQLRQAQWPGYTFD